MQQLVTFESIDVLCGSGEQAMKHPGNIRFCAIVKKHYDSLYSSAGTKQEKMKVTKLIFDETIQTGARFLKKDPVLAETWYLVRSRKVTRDKISHHLRRMIKNAEEKNRNEFHTGAPLCDDHPTPARGDCLSRQLCGEEASSKDLSLRAMNELVNKPGCDDANIVPTKCHSIAPDGDGLLVAAWQSHDDNFAPLSTTYAAPFHTSTAYTGSTRSNTAGTINRTHREEQGTGGTMVYCGGSQQPIQFSSTSRFVVTDENPHISPTSDEASCHSRTQWAAQASYAPSRSSLCSFALEQQLCNSSAQNLQQPPTQTSSLVSILGSNDGNIDSNSGISVGAPMTPVATANYPLVRHSLSPTRDDDDSLNLLITTFLLPNKTCSDQDGHTWGATSNSDHATDILDEGDYEPITTFR